MGLVCPYSFSYPGGVQEHVRGLYRFLKGKGWRVRLLLPRHHPGEYYGKDVALLGGCFTLPAFGSKTNVSFAEASTLRAFLDKEKFDLLHFHNPFSPFLSWQILENYTGVGVATLHANTENERNGALPFLLAFLNLTLAPKIGHFMAVSRVAREILRPSFWGKISLIPNGVDLRRFHPKVTSLPKWRGKILNILYLGRIDERKGLPYLLDAFKILKKDHAGLRLLVGGEGELKKTCQEKVKKERIDGVKFLGFVKDKELPHLYASADIYCSPAVYGESFGVVLLEAMAAGKPVAAFDIEGYREVLTGPAARFLAPAGEVEELARVLAELVENESRRREMGEWGRAEVRAKYDWEVVGEQVLAVYREALEEKRKEYH